MNCPACGFNITKDYKFCPSCGSELLTKSKEANAVFSYKIIICDVCGEENSADSKICSSCGAKLDIGQTAVQTSSPEKNAPADKPVKEAKNSKRQNISREQEITQREKESVKKSIKHQQQTTVKNKPGLSPLNVVLLIAGLLLLGYVILDLSGIFDIPEQTTQISDAGSENGSSQINLADLKKIEELEKSVQLDSTKTDSVLELAHKLGDAGFLDKAVKYYEMYLRQNPGNADVNVDLGVVFFELKQYDKAKSRMMKGINLNPVHQIAHFNIGVVNSSEGKLDSAKIWWKKAVEINPATEIGRRAQELLNQH